MTVVVRAVEASDRADWARLFRGYRDFYAMDPDEGVVDTVWSWLLDETHELHGLVAERDGAPVGIAHWRRFARPLRGGAAIHLDDLFTDPAARGGGVATALVAELQRIAAGEGLLEVRWITSESNADAQRLYERIAQRLPFLTYAALPA